jgi:hypothetical protein
VILATKLGLPMDDEERLAGGSRRYVLSAVEESLKRFSSTCELQRPAVLGLCAARHNA